MEITEAIKAIFQYGGTVVMAALFVWIIMTDRIKNNASIEKHTQMLEALSESQKALTESNNNIAKALDIISNNLVNIDSKIDRNYTEIVKGGK